MRQLTVKDIIKIAVTSYETYLDAVYVNPDPELATEAKENVHAAEQLLREGTRRETPQG